IDRLIHGGHTYEPLDGSVFRVRSLGGWGLGVNHTVGTAPVGGPWSHS
ncbi:hypothetical protein LCGC14_2184190, partial [marine sediment metagenome]